MGFNTPPLGAVTAGGAGGFVPLQTKIFQGEIFDTPWLAAGRFILQDVFGLDPKTTGAAFISIYFLLFAVSRLVGGFFIEKTGYLRSVLAALLLTLAILVTGFSLGSRGIWLLPVTGLFIGIIFPTVLAMSIGAFRERAQAASSAIIVISFSLNGAIQYLIGIINRLVGEAWGYRSCVLYGLVLIFLLINLQGALRKRGVVRR